MANGGKTSLATNNGNGAADSRPIDLVFPLRIIAFIGATTITILGRLGGIWFLFQDTTYWLLLGVFRKKARIGRAAIISQMVRLGVRATTIVLLLSGCIGSILALQMQPPLADFGQVDKIANILSIAVLRELGPLMSAIILTGFAGAAIAAEVGTMVVGEEIEALEATALNPIRFLVVPRVIAAAVSTLCLTVFANIAAIAAGMAVTVYIHGVPAKLYWDNTVTQSQFGDLATGMVKGLIFGLLIGLIACYNGLKVTGGAAGVGRATTDTVVASIVSIIFADLFFTAMFFMLGWT